MCYYSNGAERYNPTERTALLNLKDGLFNNSVLQKNWSGPQCYYNVSQWIGITCFDGRVTGIRLEEMGLQGSIKENALLNLTELKDIVFRENRFTGFLPSLSTLLKLQFIDFSHNKLTGPMPEHFSASWRQLKLHYNSLNGSIPLSILNCSSLEIFEVQNNSLSGTIPAFNQSKLQVFNVSNNNLKGPIPNTPIMQSFNGSSFLGNPGLCGKPLNKLCPIEPAPAPSPSPSPPSPGTANGVQGRNPGHKTRDILITVIVVSAFVCVVLLALFFYCCYRMTKAKKAASKGSPQMQKNVEITETFQSSSSGNEVEPKNKEKMVFTSRLDPPGFDIDDLLRASAELLGRGNFGSTYKAVLETGESLVVKRLKDLNVLTKKDFDQQMKLLSKLQHSNLVPISAYYFAKEDKLVVYDYMPNGSLFDRLHGARGPGRMPLNWKSRFKIAQGVAQGMAYLHTQCPQQKTPHVHSLHP
ncbi:hypothetical protein SUGI_0673310 [Cryptomeria japonica]|nr:hypothetical protein SUGI_0673310 [Cryptomeria japonica]